MWRMYRVRPFAAVVVATMLCASLFVQRAGAQSATLPCDPKSTTVSCKQTTTIVPINSNAPPVTQQVTVTYGNTSWQGLNWGIGLAADFDMGGKRITNATIDPNGIVRVTDSSGNVGVSFVLEAHYFFKEWLPPNMTVCSNIASYTYNCNDVAIGPFVAIEVGGGSVAQPTGNGLISGYALGMMVGLHHPDPTADKTNNSSWNFGVGLRVDPKTQVFADGVHANMAPPPNYTTQNLFKYEPRYGVMLLSSFSF
jgi:hypothetical protein